MAESRHPPRIQHLLSHPRLLFALADAQIQHPRPKLKRSIPSSPSLPPSLSSQSSRTVLMMILSFTFHSQARGLLVFLVHRALLDSHTLPRSHAKQLSHALSSSPSLLRAVAVVDQKGKAKKEDGNEGNLVGRLIGVIITDQISTERRRRPQRCQ